MYDTLRTLLTSADFPVVESLELPERPARYGPVPQFLSDSSVGALLGHQELWSHQAEALDALGCGENVVVSTGTASGKSLIFQALAFHRIFDDPSSRVVVFYPLRALVEDQVRSWREIALQLGLPEDAVGLIYGGIPSKQREATLRQARIVVMTPDVCQAWLMPRLAMPTIKKFIRDLSVMVLDEAHTLEGVFGSNVALLIRRLVAARDLLLESDGDRLPLQFIAATATIANPGEHMQLLTGRDFTVIDQAADGSPHHTRLLAHVASEPGDELSVARDLQHRVLAGGTDGGFITFVDSRKNVEALAMATARDVGDLSADAEVMSYRAGFDADDRRRIEKQLRDGTRRGVVSTSALELGIDFPHLRVGFNVAVPPTRKAYRQRLGRVGRHGPGAFVLIGPDDAFTRYGTSFAEYHDMSVEPSYLYLDNRFMQFAHARCLVDELGALGAPKALADVAWPSGFRETYQAARLGADRPLEFDPIARLGGDTPHINYPLRNVGETNFEIKFRENSDSIGDITQAQALRECYPGATYLHGMKKYEVFRWSASTYRPYIGVRARPFRRMTSPRIRTWINAGITRGEIIGDNIRKTKHGLLAECEMQVTERVEGYTDSNGVFHSYSDLQETSPNMKPKTRQFRTSGVVLFMDGERFQETSLRAAFVDRLRDTFLREYSILPQDIGRSATNIALRTDDGKTHRGRSVVVFDETYGSLRLTEKLYTNFRHILGRVISGLGEHEPDLVTVCRSIQSEFKDALEGLDGPVVETLSSLGDYLQVFSEGSVVFKRDAGTIGIDVEVIEPTIRDGTLYYRVKTPQRLGRPETRSYYPASLVEPSADADRWEYAWWNPETETYVPEPDGDD